MIYQNIYDQMDRYLTTLQNKGIDAPTYYRLTDTSEKDLVNRYAKGATQRVATNLVLEAIAKREKMILGKAEYRKDIKDIASDYHMKEQVVHQALPYTILSHDVAVERAIDFVTKSAKQV